MDEILIISSNIKAHLLNPDLICHECGADTGKVEGLTHEDGYAILSLRYFHKEGCKGGETACIYLMEEDYELFD